MKNEARFVKPSKLSTRSLHVDYDSTVQQRQLQHTDCRDSERRKRPITLRPAADKTVYAAAPSVPGVEKRAQHIVAGEIEPFRFINQQDGALPPVERRGHEESLLG
jgi:hypothetical protein